MDEIIPQEKPREEKPAYFKKEKPKEEPDYYKPLEQRELTQDKPEKETYTRPRVTASQPYNIPAGIPKEALASMPAWMDRFNAESRPKFQTYLLKEAYTPLTQKNYHITIGGPNADHLNALTVYEDALPSKEIFQSYKSLKERVALNREIRSRYIKVNEGEYIDWKGSASSLNSRLKLTQFNPFNTNPFSENPYKGLPRNFLIYKSCYPVQYDKTDGHVKCVKGSLGLQVRIYGLRDVEVNYKDYKFNIWREVEYYQFIRNNIQIKMMCPNFISSYCYFRCKDANLNFGKNLKTTDNSIVYTNESIVILTECPDSNLYQWASHKYITDGNINKQIESGNHTEEEWLSIIAQMMMVFVVMEKNNFAFKDMSIQNNFYVKKVEQNNDIWRYTVDKIDYFIPNKGWLLLFDSDYHDLDIIDIADKNQNQHKIRSTIFGDSKSDVEEYFKESVTNCFNINSLSQDFINAGGVMPTSTIKDILDTVQREYSDTSLFAPLLPKVLGMFLHNRIGTLLRPTEISFIGKDDTKIIRKGDIIVYEEAYDTYKFLLCIDNVDQYRYKCITIENNKIKECHVNKDMSYTYLDLHKLYQDTDKLNVAAQGFENIIEGYKM